MTPVRNAMMVAMISLGLSSCATAAVRSIAADSRLLEDGREARARMGWAAFREGFVEGLFHHDPYFAVYQGRHDFDGQLPDWSEAGLKAQADFLEKAVREARDYPDAALKTDERFERDYLIAVARGRLFWLTDADQPHANPAFYLNGGQAGAAARGGRLSTISAWGTGRPADPAGQKADDGSRRQECAVLIGFS